MNEQKKQQVIALGRLGWSLRRIQKTTGVRRETAAAYLREAGVSVSPPGWKGNRLEAGADTGPSDAKPAIAVTTDFGAELAAPVAAGGTHPDATVTAGTAPSDAKPAIGVTTDFGVAPAAESAVPPSSASACAVHRDAIEVGLSRGRNAMAIWQDLVDTRGFTGGYQSVKRFVRKLVGGPSKEACAVIETAVGEEAQVDYGTGPMVRDPHSGKYRRMRLFVLTLGYSRKSVRLLVFQSSTQIWAELHEQSFRRLGGCTRVVVLDNLREGVLKPDIYDPALNPVYADMLRHYGVVAMPCRVADPDRKAYVSYCPSSRLCNGEDWLLGPSATMALENRGFVQRFVEATAGIVVTVLLQSALSGPKIDCSGGHAVAYAHLFGCEQSLGPQSVVATLQIKGLPNMGNLLKAEWFVLPGPPALSIQNFRDLPVTVIVEQSVDLGDDVRLCLANLGDRQRPRQCEASNGAAAETYMNPDHLPVDQGHILNE